MKRHSNGVRSLIRTGILTCVCVRVCMLHLSHRSSEIPIHTHWILLHTHTHAHLHTFVCVYICLHMHTGLSRAEQTHLLHFMVRWGRRGRGHGEAQLDGAWTVGWLKVIYCFKCNLHARKSDRMKEEAAAAEDEKAEKNNAFAF